MTSFRIGIATGNQAHAVGEHGQRLLRASANSPRRRELHVTLQLLVQVAGADRVHLLADEGEFAVLPQARLGAGDDARAHGHVGGEAATGAAEEREGEGKSSRTSLSSMKTLPPRPLREATCASTHSSGTLST